MRASAPCDDHRSWHLTGHGCASAVPEPSSNPDDWLAVGRVALGMWQFLRPAPFPATQHLSGGQVPDTQLRAMGERTAQRYIGYHNMGLAAVPKVLLGSSAFTCGRTQSNDCHAE